MAYTRREFGRLALAGLPAAAALGRGGALAAAFAREKPDSLIDGVQIGTITYSFRSMPDQSAEAILKYVVDAGVSAIELMGGPVESFAGAPAAPGRGGGAGLAASSASRGSRGPAGSAGSPGSRGGSAARGGSSGTPGDAAPRRGGATTGGGSEAAAPGSWKGQPCEAARAAGGRAGAPGRGGRGALSPEQQAAQQEQARALKAWRTSVPMDAFRRLRRMYNDAGVKIYAWKQLGVNMSDEEFEYVFNVAEALGCTHTTLELPTDAAQLKRIGDFAMKKKIYAAYHTHTQGSMTAFDQAFAASPGNKANVDFGHYVAAGNVGGSPLQFLQKFHDRIASFHLKDRTTPEHCALNLPWGAGETPIGELLRMVKTQRWNIPATIELEYDIPAGSDAVREVRKCVDYCRQALHA